MLSGVSGCIRLELSLSDGTCSITVHEAVSRAQGIQSLSETRQGFRQNFEIVSPHLLTTFENITLILLFIYLFIFSLNSLSGLWLST